MAEQKIKPAEKKVAAAKTSRKATIKPKTAITALTATANKTLAKKTKKTEVAGLRKPRAATAKKAAAPSAKKNVPAKKRQEAGPKPEAAMKAAKPTPEERYRMVETAAYFIAERHDFHGRSDEHWAAAEREIAARLGQ